MPGGLFAISRELFMRLGTYDPGLDYWGGENIELSFKAWMCFGSVELVPCSHVGHIFRTANPIKWKVNLGNKNVVRVAKVWMDDYINYFLERNNFKEIESGDITDRLKLREKLQCRDFAWYIKNVHPVPVVPQVQNAGEIRLAETNLCIDSYGDMSNVPKLYDCHGQGVNQEQPLQSDIIMLIILKLCQFLLLGVLVEAKRVVIFPMPFTSHARYHTSVAGELTKLGHQVWLTMPDFLLENKALDISNLNVIEYQAAGHLEEIMMRGFLDTYVRGEIEDWSLFFSLTKNHCDRLLRNESFFRQIQMIQPELVIIDNLPNLNMLTVIPYRLGVPFAFLGSIYQPLVQRVPFSPAVSPFNLFPFTQHMTFGEKMVNSFIFLISAFHDVSVYSDAVARYAPEMPYLPIDMLVARAELWLVEMDHILDYPRTSLPNVKFIGGTASGPANPLHGQFASFVDEATEGVVIVSFGSYVRNLPKDISDKVLKVLLDLPMKSVFRSNLTSPDPQKILMASWIPQNDLMGHKNTKLFVSHCGKNGQYEALYHSVPVVATPIFADQPYNALRMRSKGFAEVVDLRRVSAEELRNTILKVATNSSYKQAISKASEIFRIEFGIPMERAAFWLDHVMKYGGAYMRSAGQEIPFYQFIGLDIILCYLTLVSLVIFLLTFSIYKCVQVTLCRRKQKTE